MLNKKEILDDLLTMYPMVMHAVYKTGNEELGTKYKALMEKLDGN